MHPKLHIVIAVVLALAACSRAPEKAASDQVLGESLGTINFPVDCGDKAAAMKSGGLP